MDQGSTPSAVTQRFQTLYKNLRDLKEELQSVFSILSIQNVLINVGKESKEESSKESAPTIKKKKRRDPIEELEAKKQRSYQKYLKRATEIPGFAKEVKPPAGFWDWYENNSASTKVKDQVPPLLKRIEKIWGVKPYNLEKSKRNLMRRLLSGFPYQQIDYTLDFLEKHPELAKMIKGDIDGNFEFLEHLRFEAFKNADEFTDLMKEQFPQIWGKQQEKKRR